MPQLELALDGLIEFHNMLNGVAASEEPEQPKADVKADPAKAANTLMSFLRGKAKR